MTQETGLTTDDIKRLQAPLPLEDHEARAKGLNKKKDKQQWLIYINQEGVIPLLNSIDPNWSWDVQNIHYEQRYVAVTGRLTIKGVARDGTGGNSPNGANSPVDEDTVKGAETDALKRAALRYGIGLYLRSTPTFWIAYDEARPWEGEDEALRMFSEWYRREFATKKPAAPQQSTQPPSAPPAPAAAPPTGTPASVPNGSPSSTQNGQHNGDGSPDKFAQKFPATQRATPDALYDRAHDYFNARKHFDNFWQKHVETLDNMTLEEAVRYVHQAHWNWDLDSCIKLVDMAKSRYGMTVANVLAALTDSGKHTVKKMRDWDGGNFTVAQGALLAWTSGFSEEGIITTAANMGVADDVMAAALDVSRQYQREHAEMAGAQ